MTPKVSVIIPTYNRGQFIAHAIESVLNQSFKDYEIVVIDDGSTDNTQEILKKFDGQIKSIHQENQGISKTRNRGIRETSGEYIAFLDSDDYWASDKLELQVKILDSHANVGIVYARMPIINDRGEKIGMKPAGVSGTNFKELLEVWGDLPTSTVMTRRACIEKVGSFDTSLVTMEDIDMWIRVAEYYDIYEITDQVLAYYRSHEGQITKNKIKSLEGLINIYSKIYITWPEAPRNLMVKRIVENKYSLGKEYYNKGCYGHSLKYVLEALKQYPLLGLLYIKKKDNWIIKLFKIIKPYGFATICSLNVLVHEHNKKTSHKEPGIKNQTIEPSKSSHDLSHNGTKTCDRSSTIEVSVIVPTYNCGLYIQDCLNSVLRQTSQDYEIIIIDDGSKDNTKELIDPYLKNEKIYYFYQNNTGLPAARNMGIRLARGNYILVLDADDELVPDAIQKFIESAKSNNSQWVISDLRRIENDVSEIQKSILPSQDALMDVLSSKVFFKSFFYNRKTLLSIDMYDETQKYYEDFELYIRLVEAKIPYSYVPEPLYIYKIRKLSITKQTSRKMNFFYMEQLYRKHHKRLADEGIVEMRFLYAQGMWDLARNYFFKTGSFRETFQCLKESIKYDSSVFKGFIIKKMGLSKKT